MPGREPNARLPEQVRRAAATVEAATRLHVTCSYERRLEERVEVHGWHVTFGAEHLWFDLLDHDLSGEIRGRYREWPCRTRAQLDEALVSLNRLLRPL